MRNLAEYPITKREIIRELTALGDEASLEKTGLIGDMRPLLLMEAIAHIEHSNAATDRFGLVIHGSRIEPEEENDDN